jgi:bla regulator protein BlaR1
MDLGGMMNALVRLAAPVLVAVCSLVASGPLAAAPNHPDEPDINYIYFRDADSITMAANTDDIDRVRKLRPDKEPMLWFREAGHEYVLRDPALLKQVETLWKPVRELGKAQGALGTKQGALGRQQGALGTKQGVLGTRQGTLGVREATLDMRARNESLTPAQAAEIAQQRRELQKQQRALEAEMKALEKPMKDLGDQMDAIGRQMDAIGRQMDVASAKSTAEMRALMRQTIASGAAKQVK